LAAVRRHNGARDRKPGTEAGGVIHIPGINSQRRADGPARWNEWESLRTGPPTERKGVQAFG